MTDMVICKGPECGRPADAGKGMCRSHYAQNRNGKELTPLRKTSRYRSDEEYRELWRQVKATKKNGRPSKQIEGKKCQGPECDRDAEVATPMFLCKGHWQQQHVGREYTPLNYVAPHQDPNAAVRRCNVCFRHKSRDSFHVRNNGNPQTECKVCNSYRSRWNWLKRTNRPDDAAEHKAKWDAYIAAGRAENGPE